MYVPTYDPGVVYGAWPYPAYPPYAWYPPGYVASNIVSFGIGVAVGAAIWGNCNWGRGQVNVNVNNFNSFNRTNIANGNWQHNVDHRKGVPYANSNVAERFGQKGAGAASGARDQFRGRAEGGLGNQGGQNRPGGQTPGQGAGNRTPGAGQGARPAQTPAKGGAKNTAAGGAKNTAAAKNTKNAGAGAAKTRPAAGGGAGAGVKAMDGVGRGQSVRQESARGAASRDAMGGVRDRPPSAARPSPGGGGGARAGGGGGGGARASGGGGGGGRGGGGGGGGRRSDLRLKHDVVLLGRLDDGLGFYRFSYNGSDKAYVGVIAQEVQAVMPQAVARDRDGYLRVFYDRLGVRFQTYERWIASGAHIPAEGRTLH